MSRIAIVCLLGVVLSGCQSMQAQEWPDFPVDNYPVGVGCPKTDTDWTVKEYLDAIQGKLSGVSLPANLQQEITWAIQYRRAAPHPGHKNHKFLSWLRIQTAYWHAVDGYWDGVNSKLGHAPGDAVQNWLTYKKDVDCTKTVGEMLDDIVNRLDGKGHFAAGTPTNNKLAAERARDRRKLGPYSHHSSGTTWMHVYVAYELANVQYQATSTPGMWIVDWTICELLHDA